MTACCDVSISDLSETLTTLQPATPSEAHITPEVTSTSQRYGSTNHSGDVTRSLSGNSEHGRGIAITAKHKMLEDQLRHANDLLRERGQTIDMLKNTVALEEARAASDLGKAALENSKLRQMVAEQEESNSRLTFEMYQKDVAIRRLRESNKSLAIHTARTLFESEESFRGYITRQAKLEFEAITQCASMTLQKLETSRILSEIVDHQLQRARLESDLLEKSYTLTKLEDKYIQSQNVISALNAELRRMEKSTHEINPSHCQTPPHHNVPEAVRRIRKDAPPASTAVSRSRSWH